MAHATVLIVDDDPQVRSLYGAFLEGDYDVRLADSGQTALDEMDDQIDVVLLDRRMDGLSGSVVLTRLREEGYDQPVALVTAIEPDFDILEMGFDTYLLKPVGGDELVDVVETMILRQEYDEVIREYFALVSKVTAIRREKEPLALDENDGYAESLDRLAEIKEHARTALEMAIDSGKFEELFHELPTEDRDAMYGFDQAEV